MLGAGHLCLLVATSLLLASKPAALASQIQSAVATRPRPEPMELTKARAEALRDFVNACVGAFEKSQGEGVEETATQLCTCTANEAGEEKISPERLHKETAEIAKDPKYQIHDKLLMQSFHICTADAMIEADHESQKKAQKQE